MPFGETTSLGPVSFVGTSKLVSVVAGTFLQCRLELLLNIILSMNRLMLNKLRDKGQNCIPYAKRKKSIFRD